MNLKSGLLAVGALRPLDADSQEPVALETTVVATGARPGGSSAKRELFTEETQTVLVFEKGAVIRLSAAVADGQLLFLTNKSTGKEVVTQVVRKRSFRPTNCYVDLEFTEPCPGFWGIEFPKAAVTLTAAGDSVAKKLSADEDSASEPAKPTAPPKPQEVERLKQEVTALQSQLSSLLKTGPDAGPNIAPSIAPNTTPLSAAQPEGKAAAGIGAEPVKKAEKSRLEELLALEAQQEDASNPRILVPHPLKSAEAAKEKKSSRTLLNAAAVLLGIGAAAFAAYRFGALDGVLKIAGRVEPATTRPAPAVTTAPPPAPKPVAPAAAPAATVPATTAASANIPNDSDGTSVETKPSAPLLEEKNPVTVVDAANVTEWKNNDAHGGNAVAPSGASSMPINSGSKLHSRFASPQGSSKLGTSRPLADSGVKPSPAASSAVPPASPPAGSDANSGAAIDADGVLAPKLLKGRKSMAPPEMIKNYITGNVSVDAVVDTTGHVRSVSVLSGPEKLRATAIDQMKQYLYQPAKKNGKPVSAHVQVSLQFWYEP